MFPINPVLGNGMLPVEVVFHPSWWNRSAGIIFDEDFFYHPHKRVESERRMEKVLYDRFGEYGLGSEKDRDMPQLGAVHLAAGYLVSEMLGCKIAYSADAPPQVLPANIENFAVSAEDAMKSEAWKRIDRLAESLKTRFGYLAGDVNWGGILNASLDLRGQEIFLDLADRPAEVKRFFSGIASVIELFTGRMASLSGTTSISVNRNLVNFAAPIILHSECSHTMISVADYEEHLLEHDIAFSEAHRPFGIHYCGKDTHRYAQSFAKIPNLDFLDLGWGGDVALLRKHLSGTFFNLRLDPTQIGTWSTQEISRIITGLVEQSGNPWLTGVCCINMDDKVPDEKVKAVFDTVLALREAYTRDERMSP